MQEKVEDDIAAGDHREEEEGFQYYAQVFPRKTRQQEKRNRQYDKGQFDPQPVPPIAAVVGIQPAQQINEEDAEHCPENGPAYHQFYGREEVLVDQRNDEQRDHDQRKHVPRIIHTEKGQSEQSGDSLVTEIAVEDRFQQVLSGFGLQLTT